MCILFVFYTLYHLIVYYMISSMCVMGAVRSTMGKANSSRRLGA